jgi:hypothetical protein
MKKPRRQLRPLLHNHLLLATLPRLRRSLRLNSARQARLRIPLPNRLLRWILPRPPRPLHINLAHQALKQPFRPPW